MILQKYLLLIDDLLGIVWLQDANYSHTSGYTYTVATTVGSKHLLSEIV